MIPSLPSKPSISTSIWFSVSTFIGAPRPATLATYGVDFIDEDNAQPLAACSNMSRTRDAPTPTNISLKSEPEIVKNGTFASPAPAAFASRVLPVPGGPTIRTPFEFYRQLLETARFTQVFSGSPLLLSLRHSRDVGKRGFDLIFRQHTRLCLLLPNDMAPLPPPPCI